MPQSYDRIVIHTTFSTKYRQPWIDTSIEPELHKVMTADFASHGAIVLAINGTDDHVHIVHTLPRTKALSVILNHVKSVSSSWIKTKGEKYAWFGWQDGYGSFSADYRKLEGLLRYVRKQKIHHGPNNQLMGFEQEYTRMLRAFGYPDFNPEHQFPDTPGPEVRLS